MSRADIPARAIITSGGRGVADRNALHAIPAAQLPHHVHSLDHLTEDGVHAVEVTAIPLVQYDEELAATGITARVRHGKRSLLVRARVPLRLALDGVTRPTATDPRVVERKLLRLRVTPLDHEVRDDAVEGDAIIKPLTHQLLEVRHRARGVIGVQLGGEGAFGRLESGVM